MADGPQIYQNDNMNVARNPIAINKFGNCYFQYNQTILSKWMNRWPAQIKELVCKSMQSKINNKCSVFPLPTALRSITMTTKTCPNTKLLIVRCDWRSNEIVSLIMKNEEVSRTMESSSKATDAWEVETDKNKNKIHVTYKLTINWRKLITRMTELPSWMKRPRSRGETSNNWMKTRAEILIKREWKEIQTRNLFQNLFLIKSKVRNDLEAEAKLQKIEWNPKQKYWLNVNEKRYKRETY